MSQCVPNWDLDDGLPHHSAATPTTANIHAPMSDYVVSELTWEKGNLATHGHGLRDGHLRRAGKTRGHKRPSPGAPAWEKHPASGTLEAVVDQATRALVPAAVDALVPSAKVHELEHQAGGGRVVPDSAGRAAAGSICGAGRNRARAGAGEGCTRSATGSAASVGLAFDSREINGDGGEETGFTTSTSPLEGSPETENASCGRALTAVSEGDDSCYSRGLSQRYGSDEEEKSKNEKERSSFSTKRIRAAAVHNQSERKRRDRINQRMRTLQKLVPNSSKTDKASILDEVIDYMKQLQAQVQMMSRINSMPPMMMAPMAMQQMQMAMMAQMAQMAQMGMAMGMGMSDVGQAGMPWAAFLPPSLSRDVPGRDPAQAPAGGAFLPPDPFAAFMAFQAQQPMTMDAHSRMAALYQQLHQQPPGGSSNEAPQSGGNVL